MSIPCRIRDARESDAAAIAEIYNQSVLGSTATYDTVPQSPEARLEWLRSHGPSHPVLVLEAEDGSVIGWGSLTQWSDRPAYDATVEMSAYIDERHTGSGLGTCLSRELLARARAHGHHAVIARISADNVRSIAMMARLGFEHVGTLREVGYKFGKLLDVALYELILGEFEPPAG